MASLHRVTAVLCLAVRGTYAGPQHSEHWSKLGGLAADEGDQLGDVAFLAHPTECTAHCDAHVGCNSVTYCPTWGGCFLKDGIFTGGEATSSGSDCLTYYKIKDEEDWSRLGGLAADEGEQLGDVAFFAQPTECTAHCDAHAGCNSVTYCTKWGGCFLKDRAFTGGEATSPGSDCLTYYKVKASLLQVPGAILEKQSLPKVPQLRGAATVGSEVEGPVGDTFPDLSTGFDIPGPYLEEPSEEEAEAPRPAIEGWENATSLRPSSTWGQSFCESHHTGYFCDGFTRVRCCRQAWGYVKCGTTTHFSNCGWPTGGGGGWRIHRGWRQSSFCRSHHVGLFCYSHHKVHCCNDYGHFVECTTTTESNWRC